MKENITIENLIASIENMTIEQKVLMSELNNKFTDYLVVTEEYNYVKKLEEDYKFDLLDRYELSNLSSSYLEIDLEASWEEKLSNISKKILKHIMNILEKLFNLVGKMVNYLNYYFSGYGPVEVNDFYKEYFEKFKTATSYIIMNYKDEDVVKLCNDIIKQDDLFVLLINSNKSYVEILKEIFDIMLNTEKTLLEATKRICKLVKSNKDSGLNACEAKDIILNSVIKYDKFYNMFLKGLVKQNEIKDTSLVSFRVTTTKGKTSSYIKLHLLKKTDKCERDMIFTENLDFPGINREINLDSNDIKRIFTSELMTIRGFTSKISRDSMHANDLYREIRATINISKRELSNPNEIVVKNLKLIIAFLNTLVFAANDNTVTMLDYIKNNLRFVKNVAKLTHHFNLNEKDNEN